MMKREWAIRALRTFVQAALGFAAANAAGIVGEGAGATRNALAALTVASIAAGLAALMNLHAGTAASPQDGESAEGKAPLDDLRSDGGSHDGGDAGE